MDIELARTFLEIVSTGSFIKAADRLHVGQTTVSARVRLLEQQLGRPLFVRNKAGASLTPAGEHFFVSRQALCNSGSARASKWPCQPDIARSSRWVARSACGSPSCSIGFGGCDVHTRTLRFACMLMSRKISSVTWQPGLSTSR